MRKKEREDTGFKAIAFVIVLAFIIGYAINELTGSGIFDDAPKYKVEKQYEPYLKSFVDLAMVDGVDLSYIYANSIIIKSMPFVMTTNNNNVAQTYGRSKDKQIIIFVNEEKFNARTEEGKKYVMFHELGHDVLNFLHLESPDRGMMESTAYTGFFKSYERFDKDRQTKYLYTSLGKMFDRYKEKLNK